MDAKKINKKHIAVLRYVLIATIIISSVLLAYQLVRITGAFSAGSSEWEHSTEILADSTTPEVRAHITFGDNKPSVCKSGVYVENDGVVVQFKTENEMYNTNNQCTETDIVIANSGTNTYNIYYGQISPEETEELTTLAIPPCSTYCDNASCEAIPDCDWDYVNSACYRPFYINCGGFSHAECAGGVGITGERIIDGSPAHACGFPGMDGCWSCSAATNPTLCATFEGCEWNSTLGKCEGKDPYCPMGPPPANETVDLGDAPDSTNNFGNNMTAYSGVQANFPTVHLGPAPYGPCHNNFYAQLGTEISLENESDTGPDQDVVNNINPVADTADNDSVAQPFGMDDGLKYVPINLTANTLSLPNCTTTTLPVEVSITQPPVWTYYLNIWIDYNRDGDWGNTTTADTVTCSSPDDTSEWVVQNYPLTTPGTYIAAPTITGYVPSGDSDAWMRVQLTDALVTYEDGSYTDNSTCFEDGETEDYYINIVEAGGGPPPPACDVDECCYGVDSSPGYFNGTDCFTDSNCTYSSSPKTYSTPCESDNDTCTVDHCDGTGVCTFLAWQDADSDFYINESCDSGDDCDDSDPSVNPGATEICTDLIDNDCDSLIDCSDSDCFSDPACTGPTPCDLDFCCDDGYGGIGYFDGIQCYSDDYCTTPSPPKPYSTPCEADNDTCTTDHCDGTGYCVFLAWQDADSDTYVNESCDSGNDCDDSDPAVNLGATEVCNNSIDDECDAKIDCADNSCNLDPACAPNYLEFDGTTTNFTNVSDLTQVNPCILENTTYGKIVWDNDVNAAGMDFDKNVNIGQYFVSVNSSGLNETFNSSVRIFLYGVSCPVTALYEADGHFTIAQDVLDSGFDCVSAGDCSIIDCESGIAIFGVTHFTGYAIGTNASLAIWDETDPEGGSQTKYPGDQVIFSANYTNATDPIDSADCIINFIDSSGNPMGWNASSFLYEYNRSFASSGTFDWNVTCNKTGYDTLTANDTVLITPTLGVGADLLPYSIDTTPYGPDVGDGVTTEAIILNNGTNSAGEFNVTFYVDNSVECTAQNLTLENNTNLTTSCDWIVEEGGTHTIEVAVDLENAVTESDESNNNMTDGVGSAWSSFQQGEQRRGVAHIGGPVNPPSVLCSFTVSGTDIFKSAVFDGNQYYFIGYDSFMSASALYAVDKNCNQVWSATTIGGSGIGGVGIESVPTVDAQGRVFIGSDNGNLYGFNAATGTPLAGFPFTVPGAIFETSPIVVDDIVYITGDDGLGNGLVFAIDATTGGPFFPPITLLGETIYSSIGYDDGFIYFGTDTGNVYKINAKTGTPDLNFPYSAIQPVRSAIAIVGDTLYFQDAGTPPNVYAVNKNTAIANWVQTSLTCIGLADAPGVYQTSPTVYNNRVYVECSGGANQLFMLSASSGSILQSTTFVGTPGKACTLATVNDMLYCQDNSATYGILANTITSTDWANPSLSGYSAPTPGSLGVGGISGPSGNFNLFGSPDLKPIKSDYSPYDLLGGEMVYINYTIKNVDSANASAFNVSFYADNIFTEKKYVPSLDTNATTLLSFNATVNGDGPHDLKIIVDSDSDVAESDETNNKLTRTVDVDWATFHQGDDRRGYSPVDTAPITNRTKWVFNTSGRIFSSPIIVNDVVYVGSNDNNLYAINLTNGSKIWNYTTSGWVMSTPAYYNGTIYVGSGQWPQGEKKIYAIYTNGSLRWSYTTGDNLGLSSPVISDGILYMGGHDGTLRALYASNGTQIWSYKNGCGGGNLWIENAASVTDNLIYASNNCNGLQIRNIKDGGLVVSVKYGGGLSAAVDGDVIYSIGGNQVYASNRFNGTKIWNASMDTYAMSEGTGPAIAYGMVYVGEKFYEDSGTAKFFAFNKTTGSQIWNFTATGYESVRSAPAVAAGIVYFKAEDVTSPYTSAIFALNASNGALIWKYSGDGLAPSSPAITPGSSIMVVGFNMSILAFGTFDLVPLQMNLTPSANITELQNVNINVSVRNNGSIGVGWFNISLLMDGVEQSRQEAQLDFYMTQVYSFNWTAVAGSHNLTIAVDSDDVIQNESSETNNNITTAVNVTAIPPSVTNITPVAGTNFTANSAVEITANVTDNVAVDTVFANITLPNSTSQMLQMFNASGSIYNATFSNTALTDRYNVTIIANDTAGAVNDTETTYFNILAQAGCNISVLIDGVNTTSFTNAGEPYNVTVNVTYENGSAFDTTVNAIECNGLNQFALIQSTDSVFSNCDSAIVQTGSDGIVSWTDVPTGGDTGDSAGTYNITIRALNNGTVCDTKNFTVTNRAPPAASGEKTTNVPNRANIEGSNEQILVVFDRISRSRLSGAVAGETFDIAIYDNGTAVGMPATITSGMPTGLNITILNSTGGTVQNATIKAIEQSGLNHWALIQFSESNVSSEATGTTYTDSNGNVRFTIVPTAGFTQQEVADAIGNYSVRLQAILSNGTLIFNNTINVDRTLPQPSPTEAVPNAGQIEGFNEMILILFDRISKYI